MSRAREIPFYTGDPDADLCTVSRNGLAETITGGLSNPSKMPERAFGIPATRCKVGKVLAAEPGTVCSKCYALKNRYRMGHVKQNYEKRYEGLFHPLWVPAMIFLVRWHVQRWMRWNDAGDLQSENHLRNICTVAKHTEDIRHWLSTREEKMVRAVGTFPKNLAVRLSAKLIDGDPPDDWPTTATVGEPREDSHECPAIDQGNVCGMCRACWSDIKNVNYALH